MISPLAVLEDTDWSALRHAYDVATDVPVRLAGLLSEDPATRADSVGFLGMAVLHQGSICSATAPAALFVAGILDDPRTAAETGSMFPWDRRTLALRARLLDWLREVAASAAWDEAAPGTAGNGLGEACHPDEADALAACRAIRRDLYLAVAPFMLDEDEPVREAAIGAASYLLRAPDLADLVPAEAARLEESARGASMRLRAGIALTLGRAGVAPRSLLTDPDPAVRACAALAPALDDEPAARAEVERALADPDIAASWFRPPLPQVEGWFLPELLAALARRAATFEEILAPALAVARMDQTFGPDWSWDPLVTKAFPERFSPGTELPAAQREFLAAITINDQCWAMNANTDDSLSRAGLPASREALRELLVASGCEIPPVRAAPAGRRRLAGSRGALAKWAGMWRKRRP